MSIFGISITFDRGRFIFAHGDNYPARTLMILLPWAYYDPSEYDGLASYNKTFKIHADTQLEVSRDAEVDFWYAKIELLGFGVSYTYQGSS